jgi:HK97 family phage portal protein
MLVPYILLWGNGYALINRERGGSRRPKEILPLHPSRVEVEIKNGRKEYKVDGSILVDQDDMIHVMGLSLDGITGKGIVECAKDNLGVGKAAEEFGANFFSKGGSLIGVLETDRIVDDKGQQRLRKNWNDTYAGTDGAKTAILEQGMKYKSISIPPEQAQFLGTRKFTPTEVARWFNLPPHMIADMERATFSNIDAMDLNYVKHSILPYAVNIEQELDRKLLRVDEQNTHAFKFNLDGLLRGDIKTRFESYKIGMQNGFMNANEARAKENMNPYDGGDTYWMQTNTAPIINGTNQNNDGTDN